LPEIAAKPFQRLSKASISGQFAVDKIDKIDTVADIFDTARPATQRTSPRRMGELSTCPFLSQHGKVC
jgi:hypothetical protein